MFKDVFVLKKNAYHTRMMKYIWGLNHYDFSHICPYWWLSVFNHIIFLPVFSVKEGFRLLIYLCKIIWKGFWIIVKPSLNSIQKWLDESNRKREIRREAKLVLKREKEAILWKKWSDYYKANPEKLLEIKEKKENVFDKIAAKIRTFHYNEWIKLQEQVYTVKEKLEDEKWILEAEEREKITQQEKEKRKQNFLSIYEGDNIETLLNDGAWEGYLVKMEQKKKQNELEKEAARRRAAKDRINKILRIIKMPTTIIAYTIGTAVVLFGVYGVFRFFKWTIDGINSVPHKNWASLGNLLGSGLVLVLIVILVGILVLLLIKGIKYLSTAGYKWPKVLTFRYYFPKSKINYEGYWIKVDRKKKLKLQRRNKIDQYIRSSINFFNKIGKVFSVIFKIFVKIFLAIRSAVLFLIQMLKNNCPAIEWKD